jgi:hypothetical protein
MFYENTFPPMPFFVRALKLLFWDSEKSLARAMAERFTLIERLGSEAETKL